MKKDIAFFDELYSKSKIDPWGADWRGTIGVWHDFCLNCISESLNKSFTSNYPITILDIGCGSGILTEMIYSLLSKKYNIKDYLAVDISSKAISRAKSLHPMSKVNYQTTSEDLSTIQENSFQLILGFGFLPYLTSDKRLQLFSTLKSIKSSDGLILLSSNVRVNNEDSNYPLADLIAKELSVFFSIMNIYKLFLSQYSEGIEAKLLKLNSVLPLSRLLQQKYLPKKFNQYYSKKATDIFPDKRLHLYELI
ncbi:MAG: class I SAM-dependent methyltransferase [Ignavibacteriae bacterium]|nr:class I SAM-dependent methyltransferase [Ignavibacteriota bacterium]